ncbi:enoyl-CoA hydratase-related protein [Actinocorallia sp. API 0066]|uniref:enoyl-CoA hydratase/isomerase family protein n=1 Tax=Actinocorallia sp. API 0066 TaxID=2896846 RepID=UPI001E4971C2|nr:enoyl-CoA hydratase-related protein [Actinocorallia sp. API 0066]MCD0449984.1 enoyl-CoA hydratase-related protein [Actinocorallia sp. API 0066]
MITLTWHGGAVAEITLDRPEALNALSTKMAEELIRVCGEVAASRAHAVVLSAAGAKAFCVGADLKERNGMSDADLLAQRPVFRAAFGAVLGLPQPSVAAVHGFALGGGTELALSCDLVAAEPGAVFGLPEVSIGLVPGGGGTQLMARRVGPARAADLVLTGRKIGFEEAVALGVVDRPAPSGGAREAALETARAIAANSPVATRAAKRALRHGAPLDLAAALDVEDNAWRTAALSADRREGVAAFNERRAPVWPGV